MPAWQSNFSYHPLKVVNFSHIKLKQEKNHRILALHTSRENTLECQIKFTKPSKKSMRYDNTPSTVRKRSLPFPARRSRLPFASSETRMTKPWTTFPPPKTAVPLGDERVNAATSLPGRENASDAGLLHSRVVTSFARSQCQSNNNRSPLTARRDVRDQTPPKSNKCLVGAVSSSASLARHSAHPRQGNARRAPGHRAVSPSFETSGGGGLVLCGRGS